MSNACASRALAGCVSGAGREGDPSFLTGQRAVRSVASTDCAGVGRWPQIDNRSGEVYFAGAF